MRLEPDFAMWYSKRGRAYGEKEELDKAIADLTEAIRLDPSDEDVFFYRGTVYVFNREYDLAIADLDEAIRLSPEMGDAYYARFMAYGCSFLPLADLLLLLSSLSKET